MLIFVIDITYISAGWAIEDVFKNSVDVLLYNKQYILLVCVWQRAAD